MNCPHCHSSSTTEQEGRTVHGFRRFRCRDCGRRYNERTGTALNRVQVPTDIVFLVVFWRLRYKLSLRDLAEMFLIRGFVFTHEAVRDWEAKLAPLLAEGLRKRRAGKVGRCWHVDETYVKVAGEWCYLYRAIDRDGTLVDVYLSETRDMAAAKAFLRSARSVTQVEPEQVTTDGHTSYPKAIADELGTDIDHRTSQYKNNVLEQDHRGVKGRYRPMRGFKNFDAAHRFCRAFDEVRNFLRPASYINQNVSLARRRVIHVQRVAALRDLISAA
jgi:putative transposase